MLGIEQPVQMHDEIAHMRIVDGGLRFGFPSVARLCVIRIDADDIKLREILELGSVQMNEFTPEDEMGQLLGRRVGHCSFP